MNMYKRAISAGLLSLAFVFSSCDSLTPLLEKAKNGEFTIKPSPLEQHGQTVNFDVSTQIPAGILKPKTMYELEVFYQTATGEPLSVGKLSYDGDNPPANNTVSGSFGFAYEEKYKEGQLAFKGKAYKKAKPEKFKETAIEPAPMNKGKGVITTLDLAMAPYAMNYLPHNYDNSEEYVPNNVEFFFQQGRSELRYSEKRSENAKKMDNYVSQKLPTRTVNITGMHSPEGSESINSELSSDRAAVVEKYYKDVAKKYDYNNAIDSVNFVLRPVVNDWTSFKSAIEESTALTDAQKSEIFDIVNGPGDFVSKELKLQSLSYYNRVIMAKIYPPLRTSKVEILQIKDKPTDAEIMVMAQKAGNGEMVDGLNAKQIEYAAAMTPSLEEKEKMYQASIKMSDSYAAYNNLGAVYMQMAMAAASSDKAALVDKAIANFELSLKKQKSTEAYANLASAQLLKGDRAAAQSTLGNISGSAAGELGASISAMRGYLSIATAEYDKAIGDLERGGNQAVVLFDKALAILLKASKEMNANDYPKAMSAFQEAIAADSKLARAYYGAAIVASRMGDNDKLATNLKKAIELDKSLKDRAVKDLEFFGKETVVAEATR